MNPLLTALEKTGCVAAGATAILTPAGLAAPGVALGLVPFAAARIAAASAIAFGTFLATDTGFAILSEIKRRRRLREPHPESPSLRGPPTDEELAADCALRPRTLAVRLRLGSRLADLEPTLDSTPRYAVSPSGARRIAARGPGLKGWLDDHRVPMNYSTLMKYRKLAVRLRLLLQLDPRLPLEWLLPSDPPAPPLPRDLAEPFRTARRRMAGLLRKHRNFSSLKRYAECALGIPELLAARRTARCARRAAAERRRRTKQPPVPGVTVGERTVLLHPGRLERTRREVLLFLEEPDLPPKLDRLRRKAIEWLRAAGGEDGGRAGGGARRKGVFQ